MGESSPFTPLRDSCNVPLAALLMGTKRLRTARRWHLPCCSGASPPRRLQPGVKQGQGQQGCSAWDTEMQRTGAEMQHVHAGAALRCGNAAHGCGDAAHGCQGATQGCKCSTGMQKPPCSPTQAALQATSLVLGDGRAPSAASLSHAVHPASPEPVAEPGCIARGTRSMGGFTISHLPAARWHPGTPFPAA